jgi:RNA polymerase sigma-70 factor (ECF subfamily)
MDKKVSIVRELIQGEKKAFEYLYSYYAPKVYNFCKKLYLTSDQAKEMVQVVFIVVWEHRGQIDPDKSFSSYLFTIAKNRILDSYKKKVVNQAFINYTLFHQKDFSFVTEEKIYFDEMNLIVEKAIDELPERCREVFNLSRKEELSYKEIAEKLNITESTVNTQISKAIKILQKAIDI